MLKRRVRDEHSLFKALSHPLRLRIVGLLSDGSMSVYDLLAELDIPPRQQPLLSRHLAILRRLGLVHSAASAQWRHYSINPKFKTLLGELMEIGRAWEYD